MTSQYPILLNQLEYQTNYQSKPFQNLQSHYYNNILTQNQFLKRKSSIEQNRSNSNQLKKNIKFEIDDEKLKSVIKYIPEDNTFIEQLIKENYLLRTENNYIKQAAIQAIIEKENIITDLQEQLKHIKNNQIIQQVLTLRQKYDQICSKFQESECQNEKFEYQLKQKNDYIKNLCRNIQNIHKQYENRIVKIEIQHNDKLQCNLQQFNKTTILKEANLLEDIAILEKKYLTQIQKLQNSNKKLQKQIEANILKYQQEIQLIKQKHLKNVNDLIIHMENQFNAKLQQFKNKQNEISEIRILIQTKDHQILLLQKINQQFQCKIKQLIHKNEDLEFQKKAFILDYYSKQRTKEIYTIKEFQISFKDASESKQSSYIGEGVDDICQLEARGHLKFDQLRTKGVIDKTSDIDESQYNMRHSNINISQKRISLDFAPNSTFNTTNSWFFQNSRHKKSTEVLIKQELNEMLIMDQDEMNKLKEDLEVAEKKIQDLNQQISNFKKEKQKMQQYIIKVEQRNGQITKQLLTQIERYKNNIKKLQELNLVQNTKQINEINYLRQKNLKQKTQYTTKIAQLTDQKAFMQLKIHKLQNSKSTTSTITNPFKFFINF